VGSQYAKQSNMPIKMALVAVIYRERNDMKPRYDCNIVMPVSVSVSHNSADVHDLLIVVSRIYANLHVHHEKAFRRVTGS